MATLQLGDLTFHSHPHSSGLYFRKLTDWYTVPDSKATDDPRSQDHGSFDGGEDYRISAAVSFDFMYVGSSRADALRAKQSITGALATGKKLPMTLDDELGATTRRVSVRNVKIPDERNQPVVQGSVDTLAPDPRRYGPAIRVPTGLPVGGGGLAWPLAWPITWAAGGSDGRVTAVNPGTADTFSLLEVTGGLTAGFSVVEVGTGREIRLERLIPVGSTAYVNPRTGRAYLDSPENDISGFLTRTEWWTVARGGSSTLQFNALGGATGAPTLTAVTQPAYW